jgi:hypothetical protein
MVDPAVFAFAAEKQPAYDPKKISGLPLAWAWSALR